MPRGNQSLFLLYKLNENFLDLTNHNSDQNVNQKEYCLYKT